MGSPDEPSREAALDALETLRMVNEVRELTILNTPVGNLANVDVGALTLGQSVVLANALRAVGTLRDSGTPVSVDDDAVFDTEDGPVRYTDVPRGDDGNVDDEWLAKKCTCAEHVAARGGTPNGGMYL